MFYNCLRAYARIALITGALGIPAAYAASPVPTFPGTTLAPRMLVRAVLQQNQGIAAMRAAVDAAHARTESAGALPDPMLSYMAAPNTFGYAGQGLNQNLQISQTFPWPGTLHLRTEAAQAEIRSAAQELADLRLQLAAQARAAYAEWYYAARALAINADNQTLLAGLRKVAETAYAAGHAKQQDVLQAEVELTRLQNQALELKRRQDTVRAKINGLLTRSARAPLPPPADLPMPRQLPAFTALRKDALNHYPALKSLNAQIAASRARLDLTHKDSWPSFTIMAGYNSLWDAPQKRLTVGVGINIPFGGNHRGEIAEAHAKLDQSQAKLANARSQLLSQLDQAYATVQQDDHSIRLYTGKLLPLAQQNLDAAKDDYRNGSGDFLDLITAERQYLMVQLELARTRADLFTQFAALNYRSGGRLFAQTPGKPAQEPSP